MLKAIPLVLILLGSGAQAQPANENPFAKPSQSKPAPVTPAPTPGQPTVGSPTIVGQDQPGQPPDFTGMPFDPSVQGGYPVSGPGQMAVHPSEAPPVEMRVPVTRIGVVNGQAILKGEHGYFFEKLDKKAKAGGRKPVETLPGAGGKPTPLPAPILPPNGQPGGVGGNGGALTGYNGGYNGMGPYTGHALYPGHVTNAPR